MRSIVRPSSSSPSSSLSLILIVAGGSLLLVSLIVCISYSKDLFFFSLSSFTQWKPLTSFNHSLIANKSSHFHNDDYDDKGKRKKKKGPEVRTSITTSDLIPFRFKNNGDYEKLKKIEARLSSVRALIKEAAFSSKTQNTSTETSHDPDYYIPQGDIYRNPYLFHRSYQLMEKVFKIFVYEEGETPLFHNGPCKSIYSTEGMFINMMEVNERFRTRDPDEAHVYFLPFSVVKILQYLFHPVIRDKAVFGRTISDYIRLISLRYPYWNRTLGADHFMLSCHDWGPRATWYVPQLYFNSIRVLCNANTSERFNPKKDVSFPEINLKTGDITGLTGGPPPSNRTILAFFAGGLHGHMRRPLLKHWKEKDKDLRIYERLPDGISYEEMMNKSKYCICPSGHEVASPRIVEAIYAECVPVLISQGYILPFSDVLDWKTFSVEVSVSEIPNLKKILMDIPYDRYVKMQKRVKQVQMHFVVNNPPKRYDIFHMIIHSIWLRRLNAQMI